MGIVGTWAVSRNMSDHCHTGLKTQYLLEIQQEAALGKDRARGWHQSILGRGIRMSWLLLTSVLTLRRRA